MMLFRKIYDNPSPTKIFLSIDYLRTGFLDFDNINVFFKKFEFDIKGG